MNITEQTLFRIGKPEKTKHDNEFCCIGANAANALLPGAREFAAPASTDHVVEAFLQGALEDRLFGCRADQYNERFNQ
jgi:hypothetical protein